MKIKIVVKMVLLNVVHKRPFHETGNINDLVVSSFVIQYIAPSLKFRKFKKKSAIYSEKNCVDFRPTNRVHSHFLFK